MRRTLMATAALLAGMTAANAQDAHQGMTEVPSGSPNVRLWSPPHDMRNFHVVGNTTLVCSSPTALLTLSQPGARERLGEINYIRMVTLGNCGEVGNKWPFMICYTGPQYSFVAQRHPGGNSSCRFILTRALADDHGRPPPMGITN